MRQPPWLGCGRDERKMNKSHTLLPPPLAPLFNSLLTSVYSPWTVVWRCVAVQCRRCPPQACWDHPRSRSWTWYQAAHRRGQISSLEAFLVPFASFLSVKAIRFFSMNCYERLVEFEFGTYEWNLFPYIWHPHDSSRFSLWYAFVVTRQNIDFHTNIAADAAMLVWNIYEIFISTKVNVE